MAMIAVQTELADPESARLLDQIWSWMASPVVGRRIALRWLRDIVVLGGQKREHPSHASRSRYSEMDLCDSMGAAGSGWTTFADLICSD